MKVSVIICTKNRATDLEQTLRAFEALPQMSSAAGATEVIVVDNDSNDQTKLIIEQAEKRLPVRYVWEGRGGQSGARNAGLRASHGEYIVFTDDDVRPAPTWIDAVTAPLRQGRADIVAGGVRLADHLLRPWMEARHLGMLAANTHDSADQIKLAVGANLVFHRRILEKVPGFDVELGPGASGFCDDLLFNFQVQEAGFRLVPALHPEATVVHYPDPSRLTRAAFEMRLLREGKSLAYVAHHWRHNNPADAKLRSMKRRLRLASLRVTRKDRGDVPNWTVMNVLQDIAYYDEMLKLRGVERNYEPRGLVKIAGVLDNGRGS